MTGSCAPPCAESRSGGCQSSTWSTVDAVPTREPACTGGNVHFAASPEQLTADSDVPETRKHFLLVWMSEIEMLLRLIDHCCFGPPVQVCSSIALPFVPAQRSLMTRNAPWKEKFCAEPPLHAAVFSLVPVEPESFGSSRQVPVDLLRNGPA